MASFFPPLAFSYLWGSVFGADWSTNVEGILSFLSFCLQKYHTALRLMEKKREREEQTTVQLLYILIKSSSLVEPTLKFKTPGLFNPSCVDFSSL